MERLRVAAGEGRLEADELEERVAAALRARTYGDLAKLVADLPGERVATRRRPRSRTALAAKSAAIGVGVLTAATIAVVVIAVVTVVMVATAAWWLAFVLVWMVCWRSRRRVGWGPRHRRRRAMRARPSVFY